MAVKSVSKKPKQKMIKPTEYAAGVRFSLKLPHKSHR